MNNIYGDKAPQTIHKKAEDTRTFTEIKITEFDFCPIVDGSTFCVSIVRGDILECCNHYAVTYDWPKE